MGDIFAIDTLGSAVGQNQQTPRPPELPAETPTKEQLRVWTVKWDAYLSAVGYMCLVQGLEHPSLLELAPRDVDADLPALDHATMPQAAATRDAQRSEAAHKNRINALKHAAALREMKHRLASLLITALEPKAGLRLSRLKTLHLGEWYRRRNRRDLRWCGDVQGASPAQ